YVCGELLLVCPLRQSEELMNFRIIRSGENQNLIVRLDQSDDVFFECARKIGCVLIGGCPGTLELFGCDVPGTKPGDCHGKDSEQNADIDARVPERGDP